VDDVTERLRLIESMKTFCTDYLGLVPNNSFTKIINKDLSYYMGMSPKDSIKILSSKSAVVQYNSLAEVRFIKDYYNKRLVNKKPYDNIDIYVQRVLASVSHLQNDTEKIVSVEEDLCEDAQITPTVLNLPRASLVALIIHENIHIHAASNHIYIKLPIEESIADVIAYQGSKIFYKNNNEALDEVEKNNNLWERFYNWCDKHTKILNKTYKQNVLEGRKLLEKTQEDYRNQFPDTETINNAFFMMWLPYTAKNAAVRRILRKENPAQSISKLGKYNHIVSLKELDAVINS